VIISVRKELYLLSQGLHRAPELLDLGVGLKGVQGLVVDAVEVEVVVLKLQQVQVPLGVEHEDQPVHGERPHDAVRARHLLNEEGVGLVEGLVYQDVTAVLGPTCLVHVTAGVAVAQVVAVHELLHVNIVQGRQSLIAEVPRVGHLDDACVLGRHGNEALVLRDDRQVDEPLDITGS
jgi:hypothetical protein